MTQRIQTYSPIYKEMSTEDPRRLNAYIIIRKEMICCKKHRREIGSKMEWRMEKKDKGAGECPGDGR